MQQENEIIQTKGHSRQQPSGMTANLKVEALNQNSFRAPLRFGFTLIELLVVVLIIAILAAIALPQYQKAVKRSTYAGMLPVLATVVEAQNLYYMTHGEYAEDMTKLEIGLPITGTCIAGDFRMRAVDVGYQIGEYCVYLTDTVISGENTIGVLIGLASEKFGLTEYKARISGYEYLFTSGFSNRDRPAKRTYCRGAAGIGKDNHCTGELINDNNYGAWWKMN